MRNPSWFEQFKETVWDQACDWLEENYRDYDDFSYAYDDMMMDDSVTGNASGRWSCHDDYYAEKFIWDNEFIHYINSYLNYNLEELISGGKESVVVLACFYIIDFYIFEELQEVFNELKAV